MPSTALVPAVSQLPRRNYGNGAYGAGASARDPYYAEVVRLRERCEELEEQVRYFKDLISPPGMIFPQRWRLTGKEAILLRALMASASITKDRLLIALYDTEPEVEIKIVDVFVCKLRNKLARDGIKIETMWGSGYRVAPPMKAMILSAAAAAKDGTEWVSPLSPASRPFEAEKRGSKGGGPVKRFTGAEIRQQRLDLGLSQLDVARLAKLPSPCYVSSVESGTSIVKPHTLIETALRAERRKRMLPEPAHAG